jgi:hypothetical protein
MDVVGGDVFLDGLNLLFLRPFLLVEPVEVFREFDDLPGQLGVCLLLLIKLFLKRLYLVREVSEKLF